MYLKVVVHKDITEAMRDHRLSGPENMSVRVLHGSWRHVLSAAQDAIEAGIQGRVIEIPISPRAPLTADAVDELVGMIQAEFGLPEILLLLAHDKSRERGGALTHYHLLAPAVDPVTLRCVDLHASMARCRAVAEKAERLYHPDHRMVGRQQRPRAPAYKPADLRRLRGWGHDIVALHQRVLDAWAADMTGTALLASLDRAGLRLEAVIGGELVIVDGLGRRILRLHRLLQTDVAALARPALAELLTTAERLQGPDFLLRWQVLRRERTGVVQRKPRQIRRPPPRVPWPGLDRATFAPARDTATTNASQAVDVAAPLDPSPATAAGMGEAQVDPSILADDPGVDASTLDGEPGPEPEISDEVDCEPDLPDGDEPPESNLDCDDVTDPDDELLPGV